MYMHNYFVVNGGWSSWTNDGSCSRTCGRGRQKLIRTCSNPRPFCGGRNCLGLSIRYITCNSDCCPGKIAHTTYIHNTNYLGFGMKSFMDLHICWKLLWFTKFLKDCIMLACLTHICQFMSARLI